MQPHVRTLARRSLVLMLAAVAGVAVQARQDAGLRALDEQIGRIFESADYAVPRFGPARWLPDGAAYTTVEALAPTAPTRRDIVRYDAATGARSILVAGRAAGAAGREGAARRSTTTPGPHDGRRAARLHQHEAGVAPEHARRLLGASTSASGALQQARPRRARVVADVREVLARRRARRLRPRQQHLRRAPRRRQASRS